MKAILLSVAEGPQAVRYVDVETPQPKAGEVLIKLKFAALNRRDVWICHGTYRDMKLPIILGSDGAGEVAACGPDVQNVRVGDAVIVNPGLKWGELEAYPSPDFEILGMPSDGTFAQYVVVPADHVYPKPAHLSWEEAAALPLAGVTAYRALFTRGQLQPGETVLIPGIGSGVALFALQMAVAKGAKVYVTSSSEEKIGRAMELGAAGGVNYRQDDWVKQLRQMMGGADLVIDSIAGPGFAKLVELTKPGGRIVCFGMTGGVVPELVMRNVFFRQMDIRGTTMGSPRDFAGLLALYGEHRLHPVIDSKYPLELAAEALSRMDKGDNFGKIVLEIPE